jgi:hypothetical protein
MTTQHAEPEWLRDAREAIGKDAERRKRKASRKQAAVIERASHSRSPLGRFLRSKHGKRFAAGKRETWYTSLPIDLSECLKDEADDVKLSMSRFLAVLVALGAAQWPTYRSLLYEGANGEEPVPVPKLVQYIFENAVNPAMEQAHAERPSVSAWHREVRNAIDAHRPKPKRATDPTDAVLRGTGLTI